jgi:anti-sigma regulatory factor (Ser/Thr protein kinase)
MATNQCVNPPDGRTEEDVHEIVLGELRLPRCAGSARTARVFVRNTMEAWGLGDTEVARLAVTELVANAWKHACGPPDADVRVVVVHSGPRVRVEVHDPSSILPHVARAGGLDESGRGLLLLTELVEDWGSYPTPDGKAVWFATRHGGACEGLEGSLAVRR